jgi:hypothetical protein
MRKDLDLLFHRVHDVRMVPPDIHHGNAGGEIKVPIVINIPQIHSIGIPEHERVLSCH